MWAGVDSVWEQEKLEARKMLENAAESHTSGARFVSRFFVKQDHFYFDRKIAASIWLWALRSSWIVLSTLLQVCSFKIQ